MNQSIQSQLTRLFYEYIILYTIIFLCMQRRQIDFSKLRGQISTKRRIDESKCSSPENYHVDIYHMWKPKSLEEEQIFRAVRNSDIFSEKRTETFVKFHYRSCEGKSIDYDSAYQSLLLPRNRLRGVRITRGSMHVNDLWSQQNMQDIMGSLPFPKDRLKILNSYKQGKDMSIKRVKNKLKQNKIEFS